jgi:uncharacterized lipoprotein
MHMNRIHALLSVCLALALSLAGCALSPQVITAQPALDVASLPKDGASHTLSLAVTDGRSNPVLGYRGGVYETATVTMAEGMPARVRAGLANGFAARGFNVVESGAPANVSLAVEIAALGYKAIQGQVTRNVEVSATIRARSSAGDKSRTGEYRDTRTQEFVKPPSEGQNSVLVNEVLSAALQRLLADADLLKR